MKAERLWIPEGHPMRPNVASWNTNNSTIYENTDEPGIGVDETRIVPTIYVEEVAFPGNQYVNAAEERRVEIGRRAVEVSQQESGAKVIARSEPEAHSDPKPRLIRVEEGGVATLRDETDAEVEARVGAEEGPVEIVRPGKTSVGRPAESEVLEQPMVVEHAHHEPVTVKREDRVFDV